jgi:hypothetical protein
MVLAGRLVVFQAKFQAKFQACERKGVGDGAS